MGYPLLIEKSAEPPVPHSSQPLPPPSRISVISVFWGWKQMSHVGRLAGKWTLSFAADLQICRPKAESMQEFGADATSLVWVSYQNTLEAWSIVNLLYCPCGVSFGHIVFDFRARIR